MRNTVSAPPISNRFDGFYQLIQKFAYAILIFIFIQLMNQFLILTGSALERELVDRPNPQFFVGVFQQIIQAGIGIILFRLIFQAGVQELGINLKNRRISIKYFLYKISFF